MLNQHTILLFIIIQSIAGFSPVMAQYSINIEQAQVKSALKETRVLEQFDSEIKFSQYGGCLEKRVEETGFFSMKKVDGAWYLVDPDGYLYYSVGINSVVKGGEFVLPDSLYAISSNTMGSWSDETINEGELKMAYTPRFNMMLTYKNTTQRTKNLYNDGIIPVFDPGFENMCNQIASASISPLKNDPYILGHFSDNELPIYDNTTYGYLLDRFLKIADKNDPNYLAANNWMLGRKGENYYIAATDREEFHGYVMGTYYRIVNTAIKKYDPNHLYLGSRLHGGAKDKPSIFREAGKYVDVISINVYNVWTPEKEAMDMWANESGKPFLVTEFYAKAEDTGMPNTDGAGWLVKTQEDRARFFENFTLGLLTHPGSVGFHYFKYIDKDTYNTGLVDLNFNWYAPLKNSFYKIGKNIYQLRNFMMNGFVADGVATIFSGKDYGRKARLLAEKHYTAIDLDNKNISGSSIVSIKIKPGYQMVLYSGNSFDGDSSIITGNVTSIEDLGLSFQINSLKVLPFNSSTGFYQGFLDERQIDVFPNPFNNFLEIKMAEVQQPLELLIYNGVGRIVGTYLLTDVSQKIDTQAFPSGIFTLSITDNGNIQFKKVLKMKDIN